MQMNFKRLFTFIIIALAHNSMVFASEGHGSHGANDGVPIIVLYQAINVGVIIFALYFMLRHKAKAFFSTKREEFISAQDKAKSALIQAEHEHHDVHTKLIKLEATKHETIMRAKADANELRNQLMQDAENVIKRVKQEASLSAKIEIEKAKAELRNQLLKEAFEIANKEITNKATKEDQLRLQQDFINKVQVVK